MTNALTSRQKGLYLSIGGFGVLAAVLSMGTLVLIFLLLTSGYVPFDLIEPATLATTLTSMLFWWLFVVYPNRLTLLRGVIAAIVSIICGVLLMWVFILGYWAPSLALVKHPDPLQVLAESFFLWILSLVFFLFVVPIGWIILLIGGSAGGLFTLLLRHIFHVTDEVKHKE